jgi:hypothetical protein
MNKFASLVILVIMLYSCKTQQLYINVVEPAPVTIPQYIKSAGVIDRSLPSDATKGLDIIDKVLSLEGANLDKEGAEASIAGLTEELMRNNRFTVIQPITNVDFRTAGLGLFPPPLEWSIVEKTCRDNKVDALFSLEIFDTDTKISYQARKTNIKTPLGLIPALEQQADMLTTVKTGWRIYDPSGRAILDEIALSKDITFTGRGINPVVAAAGLINRKDAVKQVGNKAGQAYAWRILPYELRVTRDYYVKGTDNFTIAKRKAQTGNWDQAGQLWEKETANPKREIAGRACYNMAIISEINGDLDMAVQWAQKAYEDYNNRLALRYIDILRYRKTSNRILQSQEER